VLFGGYNDTGNLAGLERKIAEYLKNLFNALKLPLLFIPAQVHPLVGKS
jgi:hypothetical protein